MGLSEIDFVERRRLEGIFGRPKITQEEYEKICDEYCESHQVELIEILEKQKED